MNNAQLFRGSFVKWRDKCDKCITVLKLPVLLHHKKQCSGLHETSYLIKTLIKGIQDDEQLTASKKRSALEKIWKQICAKALFVILSTETHISDTY